MINSSVPNMITEQSWFLFLAMTCMITKDSSFFFLETVWNFLPSGWVATIQEPPAGSPDLHLLCRV